MKAWKNVRLGELLSRTGVSVEPDVSHEYSEITVRLWGKGVIERGRVLGAQVNGRRFVARTGNFIASRIDARNGAMGLVPEWLDGALVTNDFPLFQANKDRLDRSYLGWLSKTAGFVDLCLRASEGTTNRVRLKEDRFLALEIPLPSLSEQRRIVARIEDVATSVRSIEAVRNEQNLEVVSLLQGAFRKITDGVERRAMRDVAPLVRRPVEVSAVSDYPELGVRSFGKGTFHKPYVSGLELGSKRVFMIEPGDLIFSNVFAWEGAIAVAKPEDQGRVGSHRFITRIPVQHLATAGFLCFYFLTPEGMEVINAASPGGAGRNRTLGLEALDGIKVPVPPPSEQVWFDKLCAEVRRMRELQAVSKLELDALLPAILDRAFKGEM